MPRSPNLPPVFYPLGLPPSPSHPSALRASPNVTARHSALNPSKNFDTYSRRMPRSSNLTSRHTSPRPPAPSH
ncbi:MAG TPA: hypothetical protein VLL52_09640, partial [Anaerolineae bacterium]|nr:hypothetical protein [Anaerolineae bacterium]